MQVSGKDDWHTISAPRLTLTHLPIPLLSALIEVDPAAIQAQSGLDFVEPWARSADVLKMRRDDLQVDPSYAPWSLRSVSRREDQRVIGHIGFHTKPFPPHQDRRDSGGAELGYTIFPAYRRQGYAAEAARAMMHWARDFADVRRFVLSIGPDNAPSLALAAKLGFQRIGEQMDEIDGLEWVFATTTD